MRRDIETHNTFFVCCHCFKDKFAVSRQRTAVPQTKYDHVCQSASQLFVHFLHLSMFYGLPSDLFATKFATSPCSKFITQLEELKARDKSNLLLRFNVKSRSYLMLLL
jgi:hypothetical protein